MNSALESPCNNKFYSLERKIQKAMALRFFHEEKITIYQFRQLLSFSRDEADTFLVEKV